MSTRRLLGTAATMTLLAVALAALTPGRAQLIGALAHPQRTTDSLGPEAVVIALTALVAWAAWAWGVLGLTLTAGSALPGLLGAASRGVLQVLVPAGARHSAAVLLGIGVGVAAPLLPVLPAVGSLPAATAAPGGQPAPDWPAAAASDGSVPDRPADTATEGHVVVRGDSLWYLAGSRLEATRARLPTDAEVATAVHAWWTANAAVIGPDPDLLLPGQVLQPPDAQ
jgi:hypothetical protein